MTYKAVASLYFSSSHNKMQANTHHLASWSTGEKYSSLVRHVKSIFRLPPPMPLILSSPAENSLFSISIGSQRTSEFLVFSIVSAKISYQFSLKNTKTHALNHRRRRRRGCGHPRSDSFGSYDNCNTTAAQGALMAFFLRFAQINGSGAISQWHMTHTMHAHTHASPAAVQEMRHEIKTV